MCQKVLYHGIVTLKDAFVECTIRLNYVHIKYQALRMNFNECMMNKLETDELGDLANLGRMARKVFGGGNKQTRPPSTWAHRSHSDACSIMKNVYKPGLMLIMFTSRKENTGLNLARGLTTTLDFNAGDLCFLLMTSSQILRMQQQAGRRSEKYQH